MLSSFVVKFYFGSRMMNVIYFLFSEIIDSSFSENVPYSRNYTKVAVEQHFFLLIQLLQASSGLCKVSVPLWGFRKQTRNKTDSEVTLYLRNILHKWTIFNILEVYFCLASTITPASSLCPLWLSCNLIVFCEYLYICYSQHE